MQYQYNEPVTFEMPYHSKTKMTNGLFMGLEKSNGIARIRLVSGAIARIPIDNVQPYTKQQGTKK